jgi:hypothetical protein
MIGPEHGLVLSSTSQHLHQGHLAAASNCRILWGIQNASQRRLGLTEEILEQWRQSAEPQDNCGDVLTFKQLTWIGQGPKIYLD